MEVMTALTKDYEIDILIGKLAALFIVVYRGSYFVWKATIEKKPLFPFGIVFCAIYTYTLLISIFFIQTQCEIC
jgi:hypothetical protein